MLGIEEDDDEEEELDDNEAQLDLSDKSEETHKRFTGGISLSPIIAVIGK